MGAKQKPFTALVKSDFGTFDLDYSMADGQEKAELRAVRRVTYCDDIASPVPIAARGQTRAPSLTAASVSDGVKRYSSPVLLEIPLLQMKKWKHERRTSDLELLHVSQQASLQAASSASGSATVFPPMAQRLE